MIKSYNRRSFQDRFAENKLFRKNRSEHRQEPFVVRELPIEKLTKYQKKLIIVVCRVFEQGGAERMIEELDKLQYCSLETALRVAREGGYEPQKEENTMPKAIISDAERGALLENDNTKVGRKAKKGLYNAAFAVRLRELFEENNITQAAVAEKLGTTRQTICNWLLGKSQPDFETLVKISDLFETTTDYLLGRTEAKTVETNIRSVCDYTGLSEDTLLDIIRMYNDGVKPVELAVRFGFETKQIINKLSKAKMHSRYKYLFTNKAKETAEDQDKRFEDIINSVNAGAKKTEEPEQTENDIDRAADAIDNYLAEKNLTADMNEEKEQQHPKVFTATGEGLIEAVDGTVFMEGQDIIRAISEELAESFIGTFYGSVTIHFEVLPERKVLRFNVG